MLTAELKQKVEAKIVETINKINTLYGTKMRPVNVRYDINSARLGGQAISSTNTIRLNPHFLSKYNEQYINRTVVHEVVHLGIHQVYWIDRMIQVDAHGSEWKSMMIRLGADPSRCHSYEHDNAEQFRKPKQKYAYKCSSCGTPMSLGPKYHANIQSGRRSYYTNCCKAPLVFVAAAGRDITHAEVRKQTEQGTVGQNVQQKQQVKKPSAPDPKSKLGICYALYKPHRNNGWTRQQWIATFMGHAKCTQAGASTYYNTCRSYAEMGV